MSIHKKLITAAVRPDEQLTWERDGSLRHSVAGDHLVECVVIGTDEAPTPDAQLARAREAWADAEQMAQEVFAKMLAASRYGPQKKATPDA
jgi:hypothetical protein